MKFKEYVLQWFHVLVEDHKDDGLWCNNLFKVMKFSPRSLKGFQSPYDFLISLNDEYRIYDKLFVKDNHKIVIEDLPIRYDFICGMLKKAGEDFIGKYDFAAEMIESMAWDCTYYKFPNVFFREFRYQSKESKFEIVGKYGCDMDCKEFYFEHIDSLEKYKEDIELQYACRIHNDEEISHCTFICQLAYKQIAAELDERLYDSNY